MTGQNKSKPRKRKHHHNPRSYLARFTDTGEGEGQLFEHDLIANDEPRLRTPQSCGFVNDLYQVLEKGIESDAVETWLGDNRDGPGSAIISEIVEKGVLPSAGSLGFRDLMRFISFAGVRSPAFRAVVTTWESGSDKIRQQNAFVREMLLNAKRVFPFLVGRSWRLWFNSGRSGEFITSDQPLGLLNPSNIPFESGDALASRGIVVFFSLSPTVAIEGRGYKTCTGTDNAVSGIVAAINGCIAHDAHRNLYSRSKDFSWAAYGMKQVLMNRSEFVQAWRKRKGLDNTSNEGATKSAPIN